MDAVISEAFDIMGRFIKSYLNPIRNTELPNKKCRYVYTLSITVITFSHCEVGALELFKIAF